MFNAKLADDTLAEIDRDRERWNQSMWATPDDMTDDVDPFLTYMGEPKTVCGAKLCFAGHAALLAGWQLTRDAFVTMQVVNPATGDIRPIDLVAADELDIAPHSILFASINERDDLDVIVDAYRSGCDDIGAVDAIEAYRDNGCEDE